MLRLKLWACGALQVMRLAAYIGSSRPCGKTRTRWVAALELLSFQTPTVGWTITIYIFLFLKNK